MCHRSAQVQHSTFATPQMRQKRLPNRNRRATLKTHSWRFWQYKTKWSGMTVASENRMDQVGLNPRSSNFFVQRHWCWICFIYILLLVCFGGSWCNCLIYEFVVVKKPISGCIRGRGYINSSLDTLPETNLASENRQSPRGKIILQCLILRGYSMLFSGIVHKWHGITILANMFCPNQ